MPVPPSPPTAEPDAKPDAADSLPAALLLGYSGGCLDAFLYLQHGRVFAGAMTGNAVLCGIALLDDRHREAIHHAMPLLAFLLGILAVELLHDKVEPHAVRLSLACEIVGLLVASTLPASFPDPVFAFWIALLTAFQVGSFRKADRYSYNSTFITGDMRTAMVGLGKAFVTRQRAEGLRQAGELGSVVACFLLGAVSGATLGPRWGNHTLWVPVSALLVVLWLLLRDKSRAIR